MISNKCYYALKAMLELAKHEGEGPVSIGQIARAQKIPVRFLEAILRQLKQGELAISSRGKDGGYQLARPAKSISVGEVIRYFEGPFFPPNPAQVEDKQSKQGLVFENIWEEAAKALAAVYNPISFADLHERERKLTTNEASNYSI